VRLRAKLETPASIEIAKHTLLSSGLFNGRRAFGFPCGIRACVTLVAVIGAYFAADGLQASGFMAVFVFGIVIGSKDAS
jgi:NhaP-type Na+/H+ and K+/H+ antiporter